MDRAQLLWIKQQLEDFGDFTYTIPLICDYTSAMIMEKNVVQRKKKEHIDMRHHFLKDYVEKKNVVIKFCTTEDQLNDIFTKPLIKSASSKTG